MHKALYNLKPQYGPDRTISFVSNHKNKHLASIHIFLQALVLSFKISAKVKREKIWRI